MKPSSFRVLIASLLAAAITSATAQTPPPANPTPTPGPDPASTAGSNPAATPTGTPTSNPGGETAAKKVPSKPTGLKANAAAKPKAKAKAKAKPANAHVPFHGIVKSVDAKSMTVTLEGKEKDRVLHLDGESRIAKDAKDITLSGVAAGDYLHGTVSKNARNEDVIARAQAGPKPQPKPKSDKPGIKVDDGSIQKPAAPAAGTKPAEAK